MQPNNTPARAKITPVKSSENQHETQKLLILSGFIDFSLGTIKVIIGLFANSHALIADGIHSFSDLATDIMVWFFNRIGVKEPDSDHPYGHARFETFGTLVLGVLLIMVAGALIYDSVDRLIDIESIEQPKWPALIAALISIFTKEWLYVITKKLGERTQSSLLLANAWHHRSDAMSSVIVLLGVGGALVGYAWLEMFAAIGVAFMIALIGWRLSRESVEELVDTALSETYVAQIQQQIVSIEGVRDVHHLRTRQMGSSVFLDIHLQVDPAISVSEGHQIGEWVTKILLQEFHDITDVTVHIDAEDDAEIEEHQQSMAPLRKDVREALIRTWQGLLPKDDINRMTLHYLNNRINVELFLDTTQRSNDLKEKLEQTASDLAWLNQVTIWYR
jgi:cation diffusion facilitator family transporter